MSVRFEEGRTREELLQELRAAAERLWGDRRSEALGATLETTAGALWRLAGAPLEMLEVEPAFVHGVGRAEEA